jgi:hypothetical protein
MYCVRCGVRCDALSDVSFALQPGERPGNVPGQQPFIGPNDVRVIRYGPSPDDELRYHYDENGTPRDADGSPLPHDPNTGHLRFPQVQNVRVIPGGAQQDDLAYMVGPDGIPRAMDGTPLPTDAHGNAIWPAPDDQPQGMQAGKWLTIHWLWF